METHLLACLCLSSGFTLSAVELHHHLLLDSLGFIRIPKHSHMSHRDRTKPLEAWYLDFEQLEQRRLGLRLGEPFGGQLQTQAVRAWRTSYRVVFWGFDKRQSEEACQERRVDVDFRSCIELQKPGRSCRRRCNSQKLTFGSSPNSDLVIKRQVQRQEPSSAQL